MYVIFNFDGEETVEAVPYSWCKNEVTCYWPGVRQQQDVIKLIQEAATPEEDWILYNGKIIYKTALYSKAREQLNKSELTSDLASDADAELGRGKRKLKHRVFQELVDNYTEETEDNEKTPKKPSKKTGRKQISLPKPPEFPVEIDGLKNPSLINPSGEKGVKVAANVPSTFKKKKYCIAPSSSLKKNKYLKKDGRKLAKNVHEAKRVNVAVKTPEHSLSSSNNSNVTEKNNGVCANEKDIMSTDRSSPAYDDVCANEKDIMSTDRSSSAYDGDSKSENESDNAENHPTKRKKKMSQKVFISPKPSEFPQLISSGKSLLQKKGSLSPNSQHLMEKPVDSFKATVPSVPRKPKTFFNKTCKSSTSRLSASSKAASALTEHKSLGKRKLAENIVNDQITMENSLASQRGENSISFARISENRGKYNSSAPTGRSDVIMNTVAASPENHFPQIENYRTQNSALSVFSSEDNSKRGSLIREGSPWSPSDSRSQHTFSEGGREFSKNSCNASLYSGTGSTENGRNDTDRSSIFHTKVGTSPNFSPYNQNKKNRSDSSRYHENAEWSDRALRLHNHRFGRNDSVLDMSNDHFQRSIVMMLTDLNTKVDKLIAYSLKDKNFQTEEDFDIPGFPDLPIETLEELQLAENLLQNDDFKNKIINRFASFGGKKVSDCARRILKKVLTNSLVLEFNWIGVNGKYAFRDLKLKNIIIGAVQKNIKGSKEFEVETVVKNWVKYAADRDGGRSRRNNEKKISEESLDSD